VFNGGYVFDDRVAGVVHPVRVVVDDIIETFRVLLFVSHWNIIVDFFRCNDKVIHDCDSDFIELKRNGHDDGVRADCLVR